MLNPSSISAAEALSLSMTLAATKMLRLRASSLFAFWVSRRSTAAADTAMEQTKQTASVTTIICEIESLCIMLFYYFYDGFLGVN